MKTSDFDYHLPQELIAQTPVEPRDSSRLLVLSRSDGAIQHSRFHDLPRFLRKGDLLVFNDSRVFPARLHGKRLGTDTLVEIFLLTRLESDTWRALVKPGKRLRTGARFLIGDIEGEVLSVEPDGSRTVRLPLDDAQLHALGEVPLPPYIRQPLADPERFQTVYSRVEGSVAAPTAGLHFTPRLLDELRGMGVGLGFVTLHVGWGTFKPIEVENVADHAMHAEAYSLSEDTADAINRAKREGRRVIVVGTTAVRLLESRAAMTPDGTLTPGSGWTDIFITPGHR
ncbi:MAG: tRNA preQ1(34) S-adenosylmethionine ribosyltransferase-isomerase QueA, partial [Chloroflexi bacterium]|nr:tRNA preQ1(34) S-adenosylmethionine ribosyltransferase-isomerase QueA [Chloroflexota bacterium]